MTARLTVLSGPSGVGKGTVVDAVREAYPQVWVSVSATTRPPRPGEVDGLHYHFVSRAQFDRMARAGELLEFAQFGAHLYGTPRQPVLAKLADGVPTLLEIDLQGARQVRAAMPQAHLVFLAPPSWEELQRRLTGRATERPEVIASRLERARAELAAEAEFDRVIVNDDVSRAATELVDSIEALCRARHR